MRYEHGDNYLFTDDYHLEHAAAGSTWKDHKYIEKIGEGANAVYKYARKKAFDAGNAVTGFGVRTARNASMAYDRAKRDVPQAIEDLKRKARIQKQYASNRLKSQKSVYKHNLEQMGKRAKEAYDSSVVGQAQRAYNIGGVSGLKGYAKNRGYAARAKMNELREKGKSIVDTILGKNKKKKGNHYTHGQNEQNRTRVGNLRADRT